MNKKKKGRPRNENLVRNSSAQEGLPVEWTRASFIMNVETLDKLKDYAYTERVTLKEAMNRALTEFLKDKTNLISRNTEIVYKEDLLKRIKHKIDFIEDAIDHLKSSGESIDDYLMLWDVPNLPNREDAANVLKMWENLEQADAVLTEHLDKLVEEKEKLCKEIMEIENGQR